MLGTDGFGRSDSRANLRHHFEVDAKFVVIAALRELVTAGDIDKKVLVDAIAEFGIDQEQMRALGLHNSSCNLLLQWLGRQSRHSIP